MKNYRKKKLQPMTPWTPDTDMTGVSISPADKANGSPKAGDMIAVNPSDASDQWLVAAEFFAEHYEDGDACEIPLESAVKIHRRIASECDRLRARVGELEAENIELTEMLGQQMIDSITHKCGGQISYPKNDGWGVCDKCLRRIKLSTGNHPEDL